MGFAPSFNVSSGEIVAPTEKVSGTRLKVPKKSKIFWDIGAYVRKSTALPSRQGEATRT